MDNEIPEYAALVISKENRRSIGYFNQGVVPDRDAIGDVFLLPLFDNGVPDIIDIIDFFEDYENSSPEKLNREFAVNCFKR